MGLAWMACGGMLGPGLAQAAPSGPSGAGQDLGKVIAELNAAASRFKSAQASFNWDVYTAAVLDHEIQTGTIYFNRENGSTRMAAYIQPAGSSASEGSKVVVYDGSKVELYQPSIQQMTILRAGSNQGSAEAFLTLGFGGSGTSLQSNWDVSLLGMEKLSGVEVAKLDLKPKAPEIQKMFTHVTIWVDTSRGLSLKQIFYEASGDTRTTTYSDIKYNQPIAKGIFEIKPAPGTTYQTK